MSAGRIVLAIFGGLLALVGLGVLAAGGGMLWAYGAERGADGFFDTPSVALQSEGHALVSEQLDLGARPGDVFPSGRLATVRVTAEADNGVFVGIGPEAEVAEYLDGVGHSVVRRIVSDADVAYRQIDGGAPAVPPGDVDFWAASATGPGTRSVEWELEQGEWTVVIMNADGSAPVSVDASAGARTEWLLPIAIATLAFGVFIGILAVVLLVAALVRPTERVAGPSTPGDLAYPVTVQGRLDPAPSRWLWLVKWFLLIPHIVVLAFLWAAFVLLTVVAFFAILITGRYPRGIFDFNVGVLRWSWRVTYYGYGVLGTDEYPPFTLDDVPYPATFDVEYPPELSRGLVLVKWWLLAIPHFIIVGLFTNGLVWWTTELDAAGDPVLRTGGGLISILVLIAALAVAFTGRYPKGLFDLLMGLQRWVFRVAAYATLMRDEYPPFRLDPGGEEPGRLPPGGPSDDRGDDVVVPEEDSSRTR